MFFSSLTLCNILNSLHEWSSSWSSLPFFSTTIHNFPRISDLLSEVSIFQLNTVYSPNVTLFRWRFTCEWGTYFKHWSHSRPLPNICLGYINLPALTLLWFHRTAAATRYGQCYVTLRTRKVRLDINSLKPALRKFYELVKSKRREPLAQIRSVISQKTWNLIQHIHAKWFVLQS
jgi:hypothetical protein